MTLDCKHITIRVTDTIKTKDFYINKLGLTLLDDKPNFLAARAGQIRFSFFGGHTPSSIATEKYVGTTIIFSTENIKATRNDLIQKGLILTVDITNAGGYLKFISLKDPDGLLVSIAEYLISDTLEKKV